MVARLVESRVQLRGIGVDKWAARLTMLGGGRCIVDVQAGKHMALCVCAAIVLARTFHSSTAVSAWSEGKLHVQTALTSLIRSMVKVHCWLERNKGLFAGHDRSGQMCSERATRWDVRCLVKIRSGGGQEYMRSEKVAPTDRGRMQRVASLLSNALTLQLT